MKNFYSNLNSLLKHVSVFLFKRVMHLKEDVTFLTDLGSSYCLYKLFTHYIFTPSHPSIFYGIENAVYEVVIIVFIISRKRKLWSPERRKEVRELFLSKKKITLVDRQLSLDVLTVDKSPKGLRFIADKSYAKDIQHGHRVSIRENRSSRTFTVIWTEVRNGQLTVGLCAL